MSPLSFTQAAYTDCFPRVSGDEPGGGGEAEHVGGFSPRERG